MSPSILIQREAARIEGVNSAIQNTDGTRGNDQLRRAVLELEAIANGLETVKPVEATATIRSGFYLAAVDLDLIKDTLIELQDSALTYDRRMALVRTIHGLLAPS